MNIKLLFSRKHIPISIVISHFVFLQVQIHTESVSRFYCIANLTRLAIRSPRVSASYNRPSSTLGLSNHPTQPNQDVYIRHLSCFTRRALSSDSWYVLLLLGAADSLLPCASLPAQLARTASALKRSPDSTICCWPYKLTNNIDSMDQTRHLLPRFRPQHPTLRLRLHPGPTPLVVHHRKIS